MNIHNNVLMGNVQSLAKVTYEYVKEIVTNQSPVFLLCTLKRDKERFAIVRTIGIDNEEDCINQLINKRQYNTTIVIYGENMYDPTVISKYKQLKQIGFINCYIYFGGLFEWFLLQDVYGCEMFPTKNTPLNGCLQFKPQSTIIQPYNNS